MSRPLEFRAWDKTSKIMRFFKGIFSMPPFTETSTFPQVQSTPFYHDIEIMQYTGALDTNKNKIFEGDYISTLMGGVVDLVTSERVGNKYEVIYAGACFGYLVGTLFRPITADCKVIGNKFEGIKEVVK